MKLLAFFIILAVSGCSCVRKDSQKESERRAGKNSDDQNGKVLTDTATEPDTAEPAPKPKSKDRLSLKFDVVSEGQFWPYLEGQMLSYHYKSKDDLPKMVSEIEDLEKNDFAKDSLVGVAHETPSGGYRVEILTVISVPGTGIEVTWRLHSPPEGGFNAAVISQPYQFVKFPRQSEPSEARFIQEVGD